MIQDTEKTNVQFYLATYDANESDEQNEVNSYKEVIAVFTEDWELQDDKLYYTCYAHLGQHSTCSQSFLAKNCRKINKKEQYQDLKTELESIGYNLNIL